MLATLLAVSSDTMTSWGMYVLLPIFIGTLFFIMWDISKKSNAGRAGTFWIFLALGAGFMGFLFKVILEYIFGHYIL